MVGWMFGSEGVRQKPESFPADRWKGKKKVGMHAPRKDEFFFCALFSSEYNNYYLGLSFQNTRSRFFFACAAATENESLPAILGRMRAHVCTHLSLLR